MPRRRPEPPVVATALVASATRYPGKMERIYRPRQDWQAECYRQYTICGEARFSAKFFGNAVSRATLGVGQYLRGVLKTADTGPAYDALTALFGGPDGQTQAMNAVGIHLTIAGECYLVGFGKTDLWEVVSCIELTVSGDTWTINYGDGRAPITLTEQDAVIRIWLPSPARQIEADSPFRAMLPILSEIEWLTRHVFAQITSRLAGSGILMMPQSMTFPPPPAVDGQETQTVNDADSFMQTLAEAMLKPIEDPGSPSAVIPIVVTAPDEAIDKARLLTFWSELDGESMNLRNEAIRRFALGMDLPPEQVLGMSSNGGTGGGRTNGVSHWGAWQIEEATIKMHVEPMLDVITQALSTAYLHVALDDDSWVITYDTSALRLRPDRSREAFELYDRGLITAEATRRENGFSEDDRPSSVEFQLWLLTKVASGSATPDQVGAALRTLGVDLGPSPIEDQGPTRETPLPPSISDHPVRPRTPGEAAAITSALVAACEALVFRALERAGNRLRVGATKPPGVPSYETHLFVKATCSTAKVLEDAWTCAPQILDGIADHEKVVPILDSYCQSLIAEQSPHKRERLVNWLRLADQVPA
jgi:hypothetical protein